MSLLRLPVPRKLAFPRSKRRIIINRLHVPHKARIFGGGGGTRGWGCGTTSAVVEVDCAVVLTESWELTAPPWGVKAAGVGRHNAPFGKEVLRQLRATGRLKPLMGDTETV